MEYGAVARILGVRERVVSADQLRHVVARGLPKRSLARVAAYLTPDARQAAALRNQVIPLATYKRRTATLRPEESERVERLARVMALAEDALGSADEARDFLAAAHPELGGDRPIEAARTELGARQVEELLWRLEHGLPV